MSSFRWVTRHPKPRPKTSDGRSQGVGGVGGGQSRHVFALVLCCLMLFGYAGVFFGEGLGGPHGRLVEHVTYVSLAVAKCCKVLRSCWCSRFLEQWGRGGTRQHHQGSVAHPQAMASRSIYC